MTKTSMGPLPSAATAVPSDGLSILVIEDDPGDFHLIQTHLRQAGFRGRGKLPLTQWAKTLNEGIVAGAGARPDLVLLDLALPDSAGLETVQRVTSRLPDIPVIVLTGDDDPALAAAAIEHGAQDYLVKGQYDRHALERTVRHALVRSRLENRLRLFEAALNAAANGIVITDIDGNIQWANPAFTLMTGYSLSEVSGLNPRAMLKSGLQTEAFYREMWETILSGRVWRGELANRRKEGGLYDEQLAIAPVTSTDGTISNFVAIKHDITARKQTEQRLRENEERLDLALAGAGLAMWDLDVASGNLVTSRRWFEMLGLGSDEVSFSDKRWELLTHPEDLTATRAQFAAHLRGETPFYEGEFRMRHKEGHWIWVLARGKVFSRDADDNPLRVVGTAEDISSQKRLDLEGTELLKRIEMLIRATGDRSRANNHAAAAEPAPRLSTRQHEVLQLVAAGCTSAEIAERLQITTATAATHRRDLMRKLDLHSVADLTRYALQHKLISG